MISGLIRERKRPVQNLLVHQGGLRIATSLFSKNTPDNPYSVLVISSVGRESFNVRAVMQITEVISVTKAEKLSLLMAESWAAESSDGPRTLDFQSGLSQEELTDFVYEHLIFVHDLLSSSPLAAYKFTAFAFQVMSALGIKKPIQALVTFHGSTVTAINRRLASARMQKLIPSPRKER